MVNDVACTDIHRFILEEKDAGTEQKKGNTHHHTTTPPHHHTTTFTLQ
jgi:hypothetical protein